jgi:hypothetical protein
MTASGRSRSPQGRDQSRRMVPLELAQQEGSAWSGPDADAFQGLTAGALIRLAGALDTTVTSRTGSRTTPVRGLAALHPVLDHLHADECLALLAPGGSGRLGFDLSGRLSVRMVDYTLHDRLIVFRAGAATAIAQYGDGPVAFEVDRLDGAARDGWSVLISGRCRLSSLQETFAWRPFADESTGDDRDVLVVIEPEHISGRRIRTW